MVISVTYDLEKYRNKREKVLGVRKRGISFAQLTAVFTLGIFIAIGVVVIPQAIAFFSTRNLDDVIYRLQDETVWSEATLQSVGNLQGVESIHEESSKKRVVVTFNRHILQPEQIRQVLEKHGQKVVLLNVVGHGQRLKTLAEEAKFETL